MRGGDVALGFELSEVFSGSYYLLDAPIEERAISLTVRWRAFGMRRFLRHRRADVTGVIAAEGLVARKGGAPIEGTVTMRLFDEKRIPYDVSFETDAGERWRLRGQRDFFVYDAFDSLTVLPASLYDGEGVERGRAVLRFDPRAQLSSTVRSFRPRFRFGAGARNS